jgi:uncharacterized protein (DUF1015 family)
MAKVRPFRAVRPKVGLVDQVAALPYDVMNRQEAKEMAEGNDYSFLHISRSEIDLDGSVNPYDKVVYETARKNLDTMMQEGIFVQEEVPKFYIYRQIMWGRCQTGIVGCPSIDDYISDVIKKHELTRVEKEIDRINNFDYCDAHTEPVFLTYRKNEELSKIVNEWIKFHRPLYDFTGSDGVTEIVWDVDDEAAIERIAEIFGAMENLYIADGHHRSASSVKVGMKRRESNSHYTGNEEFNYFLAVIFPDEDLYIMDYNRLVKDLNGLSTEQFLAEVGEKFKIEECSEQFQPTAKHTFGMYLDNKWYKLTAKPGSFDPSDVIGRLDVSILQSNLLHPVLGIEDPRTDKRIDFAGGIRGLDELERRVGLDMKVAFSMYPTTMEDLLSVSDAGMVMPPKSTWFEPKLRSGLFVHKFSS